MAKQDYLPDQDPQFLLWHDNFKAQVAALKTTFGLTDPEVAAVATARLLLPLVTHDRRHVVTEFALGELSPASHTGR